MNRAVVSLSGNLLVEGTSHDDQRDLFLAIERTRFLSIGLATLNAIAELTIRVSLPRIFRCESRRDSNADSFDVFELNSTLYPHSPQAGGEVACPYSPSVWADELLLCPDPACRTHRLQICSSSDLFVLRSVRPQICEPRFL